LHHKHPVQDLSYVQHDSYAALMRSWLAAAVPLDVNATQHLAAFCDTGQPPHANQRDLLLRYSDQGQYMHYARQLAPMLGDISVGVSERGRERGRESAGHNNLTSGEG
jgi:hypothetical protein